MLFLGLRGEVSAGVNESRTVTGPAPRLWKNIKGNSDGEREWLTSFDCKLAGGNCEVKPFTSMSLRSTPTSI